MKVRPLKPLRNFTWPSVVAKIVWSLPIPTPSPRPPSGTALSDDDVARRDRFTAVFLDAETTTRRVATVSG